MKVIVNCKTEPVNYDEQGYRDVFTNRIASPSSFLADYVSDKENATITVTKEDDGKVFVFDDKRTSAISFFLNNEKPYAEIVADSALVYSFVLASESDDVDVDGICEFRESFDALAEAAGIEVAEYIDPNPFGLCPDGVESVDDLIKIRESEGIEFDDDMNYISDYIDDSDASEETVDENRELGEDEILVPLTDEEISAADSLTVDVTEDDVEDDVVIESEIDENENIEEDVDVEYDEIVDIVDDENIEASEAVAEETEEISAVDFMEGNYSEDAVFDFTEESETDEITVDENDNADDEEAVDDVDDLDDADDAIADEVIEEVIETVDDTENVEDDDDASAIVIDEEIESVVDDDVIIFDDEDEVEPIKKFVPLPKSMVPNINGTLAMSTVGYGMGVVDAPLINTTKMEYSEPSIETADISDDDTMFFDAIDEVNEVDTADATVPVFGNISYSNYDDPYEKQVEANNYELGVSYDDTNTASDEYVDGVSDGSLDDIFSIEASEALNDFSDFDEINDDTELNDMYDFYKKAADTLEGIKQHVNDEIENNKSEIEEIENIGTTSFDISDYLNNDDENEAPADVHSRIYNAWHDEAYSDDAFLEDSVDMLTDELNSLDVLSETMEQGLNNFDSVLSATRDRDEDFINSIDKEVAESAAVSRFIEMLREQSEQNAILNETLRKEQQSKMNYLDQLNAANATIAEQSARLDEVRRRTKFANENQKKSEEYVRKSRDEVNQVIRETRLKVNKALNEVETMRQQVAAAENEAEKARQDVIATNKKLDDAEKTIEELNMKLDAEKAYSKQMIADFDTQLNDFTVETMEKLQAQVDRAEESEKKLAEKNKEFSELSNELALTRSRVSSMQNQLNQREVELRDARKDAAAADESLLEVNAKYEAQEALLGNTEERLSKTEADLLDATEKIDQLSFELGEARSARDDAVAEKVNRVKEVENEAADAVSAITAEKEAAVSEAMNSRNAALEASDQVMNDLRNIFESMPSGFGNRKKKLDAVEKAFREYVAKYETIKSEASNE